jgi:hypothetical protein
MHVFVQKMCFQNGLYVSLLSKCVLSVHPGVLTAMLLRQMERDEERAEQQRQEQRMMMMMMMSVFGPRVQQPDASFMNQVAPTYPLPVPLKEMDPSARPGVPSFFGTYNNGGQ